LQISKLIVRVDGVANVGATASMTSGRTLERDVVLTPEGTEAHLGPGRHEFSFLLQVPTTTATHERSKHGRVRHKLSATAYAPGMLSSTVRDACRSLRVCD
jgi:hypothetical protein